MTRKPTTTLASAIIGLGAVISAVLMAENLMKGFPGVLLAPDRLALYPIAVFLLAIGVALSLFMAVLLIRYGGSVQQGAFSDQAGVIDILVGANRLVAAQAVANLCAVLAQNLPRPNGFALALIGALAALFLVPVGMKKLNNLSWELRR